MKKRKAGIFEKAIARAIFSGQMSIDKANEVYRESEKGKKTLVEMIEEQARGGAEDGRNAD